MLLVGLSTLGLDLLAFLEVQGGWTGFSYQLLVLVSGFLYSPMSLHTSVMCCICCLCPSGYCTLLLLLVSHCFFIVLHLTCVTSSIQCLMLKHIRKNELFVLQAHLAFMLHHAF